jgi:hypothetical protein
LPTQAVDNKIDAKVGDEEKPANVLSDDSHLGGLFIIL